MDKHKSLENMAAITLLVLAICTFITCGLIFLAEAQRPTVEYRAADMRGACKAAAYQTLMEEY